jgi:hypothetical protein
VEIMEKVKIIAFWGGAATQWRKEVLLGQWRWRQYSWKDSCGRSLMSVWLGIVCIAWIDVAWWVISTIGSQVLLHSSSRVCLNAVFGVFTEEGFEATCGVNKL